MVQAHHIHSPTPKPSQEWVALSLEEKMARIHPAMANFAIQNFMVIDFARDIVVSIMVHAPMESGQLGNALRRLESHLREQTGEPLEVYCEQRRDQNKPRNPEQRQKIQAWVEARKAIKIEGRNAQQ